MRQIKYAWLYKKRNFRRLLGVDVHLFMIFTLICIFWSFCAFSWQYNQLINSGKLSLFTSGEDESSLILSGVYTALQNMREIFPYIFLPFFVGFVIYLVLYVRNYSRAELVYDAKRLKDYDDKIADAEYLMKEFYFSRFLFLPFLAIAASLVAYLIFVLVLPSLLQMLEVNAVYSSLFYAYRWLFSLVMLGLALLYVLLLYLGSLRHFRRYFEG